jgi:hypothetical protein
VKPPVEIFNKDVLGFEVSRCIRVYERRTTSVDIPAIAMKIVQSKEDFFFVVVTYESRKYFLVTGTSVGGDLKYDSNLESGGVGIPGWG